ncbi:uncharacterized protein OCT59_014206 [Rhizophagus irregularis]|uniref:uncharacterized protein n=1 Tax=Rhizophagus irregularis TaxID=588596 RepID=UPI001C1C2423|nr:hypothetical protein OCT59_014206 [Rhizophagus irregularis]CAB4466726.1 unnamed protein product [Rhizophagus irregularis]CAB5197324.1 unnamed protein product [Rhizophagus irregularis]
MGWDMGYGIGMELWQIGWNNDDKYTRQSTPFQLFYVLNLFESFFFRYKDWIASPLKGKTLAFFKIQCRIRIYFTLSISHETY